MAFPILLPIIAITAMAARYMNQHPVKKNNKKGKINVVKMQRSPATKNQSVSNQAKVIPSHKKVIASSTGKRQKTIEDGKKVKAKHIKSVAEIEIEMKQLKLAKEQFAKTKDTLHAEISQLKADIATNKGILTQTERGIDERHNKKKQLEDAIKHLQDNLTANESRSKMVSAELENRIAELRRNAENMAAQRQPLKEELVQLKAYIVTNQESLAETESHILERHLEKQRLTDAIKDLQDNLTANKSRSQIVTVELDNKIAKLQRNAKVMASQQQPLEEGFAELKDQIIANQEILAEAERGIVERHLEKQKLEDAIKHLQDDRAVNETKNKIMTTELESRISELQDSIEELASERQPLYEELAQLKTYITVNQEIRDEIESSINKCHKEKQLLEDAIKQLQHDLETNTEKSQTTTVFLVNKNSQLEDKNNLLNRNKDQLSEEISHLKETKANLDGIIGESNKRNQELVQQVDLLAHSAAEIRDEIELQRKNKFSELEKTISSEKELALANIERWVKDEQMHYSKTLEKQYEKEARYMRQEISEKIKDEFDQIHEYFTLFAKDRKNLIDKDIRYFLDKKLADITSQL